MKLSKLMHRLVTQKPFGRKQIESRDWDRIWSGIIKLENALEPFAVLVAGSDEDHDWLPHPNETMCGHGGRFLAGQAFINAIETFGATDALEVLKSLEGDE